MSGEFKKFHHEITFRIASFTFPPRNRRVFRKYELHCGKAQLFCGTVMGVRGCTWVNIGIVQPGPELSDYPMA
jgi:hypothetical protein